MKINNAQTKNTLIWSLSAVAKLSNKKQITKTANIIVHLLATIENSHC